MSIDNKKTVVLSRFLCYLTIINDKLGDDEVIINIVNITCLLQQTSTEKMLFLNDKIGNIQSGIRNLFPLIICYLFLSILSIFPKLLRIYAYFSDAKIRSLPELRPICSTLFHDSHILY